jgi:hypothetical protein
MGSVAWSPDGTMLATGCNDLKIQPCTDQPDTMNPEPGLASKRQSQAVDKSLDGAVFMMGRRKSRHPALSNGRNHP